MKEIKVKFWEGRQPPPEYYAPVDPYKESSPCPYDMSAIVGYAQKMGKRLVDLTQEEVEQFAVK